MQRVRESKTFRALCFLSTYYVPTQCWEPCPQALSHSNGHHPYFTEEDARARRDQAAAQGHTSSKDETGPKPRPAIFQPRLLPPGQLTSLAL